MQSFHKVVNSPEDWFRQAWQLFEASKFNIQSSIAIKSGKTEKGDFQKVGLMHAATLCLSLSVENALKGAYVHTSKPDLSGNRLKPKHFHDKSHDLLDLANRLNLDVTDDERALLKRFSSFIVWAAKYSAPLNQCEYDNFENENKITYPHDFDFAERLIDKLQKQSGYVLESGWPAES